MTMRSSLLLLTLCLALLTPSGAWAQTLDEAARQAAKQHNAKVLSARTVQEGQKRVHVIKLLTKDGVVKTVRIVVRDR
jgi:outer membrane lipoprotein-sorting protein